MIRDRTTLIKLQKALLFSALACFAVMLVLLFTWSKESMPIHKVLIFILFGISVGCYSARRGMQLGAAIKSPVNKLEEKGER